MEIHDFSLVACPWGFPPAQPEALIAVAQHADSLGFHSFGLPHQPILPTREQSPEFARLTPQGLWPYHLDALAIVPILLHSTRRIKVGFNILQTPSNHPVHWAKYLASLDAMSGGRLLAGLGTGFAVPEGSPRKVVPTLEALGLSSRHRGAMCDEALEIMALLWTSESPVTYEGRHWTARDVVIAPKPVRRPGPELWWAGEGERSLERAARHADYLEVPWPSIERLQTVIVPGLRKANERLGGRARIANHILAEVLPRTPSRETFERDYYRGYLPEGRAAGTPEVCAELILRLRDAGVDHFVLDLHDHGLRPVEALHDQMEAWVADVLPLLG